MPITQWDAEQLEDYTEGSLFNISATKQRSNPHHNMYWSILRKVCKATDLWPTEQHLHADLKLACGYYNVTISPFTGEVIKTTDSIGFSKMTQKEFSEYFDRAIQKLTEAVGYDPLEWE